MYNHKPTERKMKRIIISEKVTNVVDTAAYFTGLVVLSFIAATAITLSSLTVGYGLADAVHYATSPTPFNPYLVPNPVQENIDCCIPPFQDEDYFVPPEVQVNDVKTIPAVYVTAKPTP
jgi:hypothetical protein